MPLRSSRIAVLLALFCVANCAGGSVKPDATTSQESGTPADAGPERFDTGAGSAATPLPTPNPVAPGSVAPSGSVPGPDSTLEAGTDGSTEESESDTPDQSPIGTAPSDQSSDQATEADQSGSMQSADAGTPNSASDAGSESDTTSSPPTGIDEIPAGHVPALVGVGYGGLRVVSRDNGETWSDQAFVARNGDDDQNLLRAITYGKGTWLTTGWNLWTSTDAVEWTEHGLVSTQAGLSACNIIEGLAYADGYFYAGCYNGGLGLVFRSSDGLQWAEYATIGDTNQHLFLDYRAGTFVAYGDTNTSFVSDDALNWETLPGVDNATFCEGAFRSASDCHNDSWFNGAYYRAEWGGHILRSTDGNQYVEVYADDSGNNLYRSRAIAEGYAAP